MVIAGEFERFNTAIHFFFTYNHNNFSLLSSEETPPESGALLCKVDGQFVYIGIDSEGDLQWFPIRPQGQSVVACSHHAQF